MSQKIILTVIVLAILVFGCGQKSIYYEPSYQPVDKYKIYAPVVRPVIVSTNYRVAMEFLKANSLEELGADEVYCFIKIKILDEFGRVSEHLSIRWPNDGYVSMRKNNEVISNLPSIQFVTRPNGYIEVTFVLMEKDDGINYHRVIDILSLGLDVASMFNQDFKAGLILDASSRLLDILSYIFSDVDLTDSDDVLGKFVFSTRIGKRFHDHFIVSGNNFFNYYYEVGFVVEYIGDNYRR